MRTISGILAALANYKGELVIGVQCGEDVVPILKGTLTDMQSAFDFDAKKVSYALQIEDGLPTLDRQVLDATSSLDPADLAAIDKQLGVLEAAATAPGTTGSTTGEQGPAPTPTSTDSPAAGNEAPQEQSPTS